MSSIASSAHDQAFFYHTPAWMVSISFKPHLGLMPVNGECLGNRLKSQSIATRCHAAGTSPAALSITKPDGIYYYHRVVFVQIEINNKIKISFCRRKEHAARARSTKQSNLPGIYVTAATSTSCMFGSMTSKRKQQHRSLGLYDHVPIPDRRNTGLLFNRQPHLG